MAKERRDSKNRILHNGEYQRSDGKYEYKYKDNQGKRHSVYSWKLVSTDIAPQDPDGVSLREQEKEIIQSMMDGINIFRAQRTTLNAIFEVYIENRYLKASTKSNYKYMYNKYVKDKIGYRNISSIRYSDIKSFYNDLIKNGDLQIGTMILIDNILHPTFNVAVRDCYIRLNPTAGVLTEIKRSSGWNSKRRCALTVEQQDAFVNYMSENDKYRRWVPLLTVMLGTGCRVSEATGLTWSDVDFDDNIIRIDHGLIYKALEDGKTRFMITTPKTKNSIREIPMFNEVREALIEEHERQQREGPVKSVVDGYSGFIFGNNNNNVVSRESVNYVIKKICQEYNLEEKELAAAESRIPMLLPDFTAHHLRHTFCTRMCENTSDRNTLNTIKEIMGHANISITLDVYTDLTTKKKKEAFAELQGKFRLR